MELDELPPLLSEFLCACGYDDGSVDISEVPVDFAPALAVAEATRLAITIFVPA